MARKSGGFDPWTALLAIGGFVVIAYLRGGIGKSNSPLLPGAIEDQIDRVVALLNGRFGKRWVNIALGSLQSYVETAMPGVASVVGAVQWAEQRYSGYPGDTKKQAALRKLAG